MLLLELLLGLIRFLLGAALFSFMNVVAWRLPRGMDPLKGRSVCPQCGHTLGAPDLVPVFSWLFLRGRCRHCGAHIPARYLLVELLGGVLALGCTWRYGAAYALPGGLFGMGWAALLALAVCGILLSVSLIDAETQTIPDRLNLALAVCGAVSVLLSPADWLPHIIGALCVSVPMFLLCLVIDGAFGGGDIKADGSRRAVPGLAEYAAGDVFRHCFWRYIRHIPAGRQKGREEGPLRLRPVSVCGHRDRDAVWRARFGMVLRVFVKFRPSKNCILALLRV